MEVSEAKGLKALEDENRRLKNQLAEAMLDIVMPKDIVHQKKVLTPAAMRTAVAHLREGHGVSERRACPTRPW